MALSLLLGIDQNAWEMFWAVRFPGGGYGGGISSGGRNADGSQSANVFFATPFASFARFARNAGAQNFSRKDARTQRSAKKTVFRWSRSTPEGEFPAGAKSHPVSQRGLVQ